MKGSQARARTVHEEPSHGSAVARRPIVVGVDFSTHAKDALARAIDIASRTGSPLRVVHVVSPLPRALAVELGATDEHVVREGLRDAVREARAAGVVASSQEVSGSPTNALRRVANEVNAALVVVGTRGRTLPDIAIGSTAERVAALARGPVLLVRQKVRGPYREVVIAADHDSNLRVALEMATFIAPDAPLSILHAYEGPYETALALHGASRSSLLSYRRQVRREARATMSELITKAGGDPSTLKLRHGNARGVLQRTSPDALLVIDRGRSIARHILLGSVTRWVIAHGTSDVLLV